MPRTRCHSSTSTVLERSAAVDAGRAHEDVDTSELAHRTVDELGHGIAISHVGRHGEGASSLVAHGPFDVLEIAEICYRDARAATREPLRNGQAHAPGRARDNRHAAGELVGVTAHREEPPLFDDIVSRARRYALRSSARA